MKIRNAKKIMGYNPNRKLNMHRYYHFLKLRPSYVNEEGLIVHPSWHDIDIIQRATVRLNKWLRNGKRNV